MEGNEREEIRRREENRRRERGGEGDVDERA